jgi:hypothetical protein
VLVVKALVAGLGEEAEFGQFEAGGRRKRLSEGAR